MCELCCSSNIPQSFRVHTRKRCWFARHYKANDKSGTISGMNSNDIGATPKILRLKEKTKMTFENLSFSTFVSHYMKTLKRLVCW